jgi:hypothetical protein
MVSCDTRYDMMVLHSAARTLSADWLLDTSYEGMELKQILGTESADIHDL